VFERPPTTAALGRLLPVAVILAAALTNPRLAGAQTELEGIRSEMKQRVERLAAVDYGLNRVVMQDPRVGSRTAILKSFVQNVQVDLDYLSAMLELVGLARDPASAAPVVLGELKGARERMLLTEFERDVSERVERGLTPPPLQVLETELLSQLHQISELYTRTTELLERVPR
jgi:hypothetical protein